MIRPESDVRLLFLFLAFIDLLQMSRYRIECFRVHVTSDFLTHRSKDLHLPIAFIIFTLTKDSATKKMGNAESKSLSNYKLEPVQEIKYKSCSITLNDSIHRKSNERISIFTYTLSETIPSPKIEQLFGQGLQVCRCQDIVEIKSI